MSEPFERSEGCVRLRVRLTPSASRNEVRGVVLDENGVAWLTAAVTAIPENGRANKALKKMLSKRWKIPVSALDLTFGPTDRRKTITISGDTGHIENLIREDLKRLTENQGHD